MMKSTRIVTVVTAQLRLFSAGHRLGAVLFLSAGVPPLKPVHGRLISCIRVAFDGV